MLQYIICIVVLFYIFKTTSYAVYVFKEKNIAGGISVLLLNLGLAIIFIGTVIYIFK